MIKFDKDKVLLLQQLIIESSGGTNGVRDFALLDSALNACFQTFDGKELYPTKEEKGARLGFTLVSNHAFVDGNKRIAASCFLYFLNRNKMLYNKTNEPVIDSATLFSLTLLIAESNPKDKDVVIPVVISILNRK